MTPATAVEQTFEMRLPVAARPLRIFYATETSPNAWFASVRSNIWRNNLYCPLVDLGHDVVEFQYDLRDTFRYLDEKDRRQAEFIRANRPKVTAELLRQIKAAHTARPFDLFFSYLMDPCIEAGAVDEIRGMGIRTVNWYCNGSYQLDLVRTISPHYDWCLVPEKFRLKDYQAMGARPIYCQEAANPRVYRPYDLPREFDVTFVGQAYGDRPAMLRYLIEHGVRVHVWGHGWKDPNPKWMPRDTYEDIVAIPTELRNDPLPDDELVKMYSRSKINLGFSTCGDTQKDGAGRIVQVRLRDFEVPMSGGFYMVERIEELGEFFALDRELVCYRGAEELLEKVRYYLSHEQELETIRAAGFARARQEHTWHHRFVTAFAEMGIGGAS